MQEMLQTHRGYFNNGKFISLQADIIPNNVEVYVVITENAITEPKTESQRQGEALREFFAGIKEIDDEPIDNEFMSIINSGINIDSGVDL